MPHSSPSDPPSSTSLGARVRDRSRLDALRRYAILDSPPEETFDRIAELAASLFNAPGALISFIDSDRQWFKSGVGTASGETSLDVSFCVHTLVTDDVMVVEDATNDPRFANNPLVTGSPKIRFYAGAPLLTPDGHHLGTLCVFDTEARTPDAGRLQQLQTLATMVMDELELRRRMRQEEQTRRRLEKQKSQLRGLADAIPGVMFQFYATPNQHYGVHFVSRQARTVLGMNPRLDGFVKRFYERLPDSHRERFLTSVREAVTQRSPWEFRTPFRVGDDRVRWVHGRALPEMRGNEVVYNGVLLDVTERVRSQEWFQQVAEKSSDVISVHDESGESLYVSPAIQSMLGYKPEDLVGRNAFELVHPDDFDSIVTQRARASDGDDVRFEYRLIDADGTSVWVETTGSTMESEGGRHTFFAVTRSIQKRKETERKLRQSRNSLEKERQRLELALMGGNLGMWDIDYTTGTNTVNDRWAAMLGYAPDDIPETFAAFQELVHPDDFPSLIEALDTHVSNDTECLEQEFRMRAADGSWRWILSRGRVIEWDEKDGPQRAVGTHMDVTDRKQQEQDLRASKIALEQAQAITQTGSFTWERATDTIHLSAEAGHLLGLNPDTPHPPAVLLNLVYPDDRAVLKEQLAHLRAGLNHDAEYRIYPKNNDTIRWLQGRGRPSFANDGSVEHVFVTLADITEMKRRASLEQRFGRLLDAIVSEIYIFRADTLQFIQVNAGARANLGYTTEQLRSMTPIDLKPFSEVAFREKLRPLRTQEVDTLVFESTHRRAGGTRYPVEVRIQLSHQETPPMYIAIVTDITNRKRYEQGLIEAKERAEEASRLKSAVVANMSHEVRTPLTGIMGFAEVLENESEGDRQQHFASLIRRSSKRLMNTLNSVLHLSKLEAGGRAPKPEQIDGAQLIHDVRREFRPQAITQEIDLQVEAPASCLFYSDDEMVRRILTNLVSNAFKFTNTGGTVTLRAIATEDAGMRLEVDDTGIGMSEAFQSRMFEAFEQESFGHARKHEGSGLGLAIVKRLVDALGAQIDVASTKGKGTRFTVVFPPRTPDGSAH